MNPDFRDILSTFCAEQVQFLIVGAYALAAHGYVRATGDIDLWILPNPENAVRVMVALKRFGAPVNEISVRDFESPGMIYQIGVAPRRIDITTVIDAINFQEAWDTRKIINLEGLTVGVLNYTHLLQNKRATGRPKDRGDVRWLEAHPPAE